MDGLLDLSIHGVESIDMTHAMAKAEAHRLIDRLPDTASWDDLMREVYVRATVEQGLSDVLKGRVRSVAEVREKYGLPP